MAKADTIYAKTGTEFNIPHFHKKNAIWPYFSNWLFYINNCRLIKLNYPTVHQNTAKEREKTCRANIFAFKFLPAVQYS
jgi:hypothetical protein